VTPEQITLVRSSWPAVAPDADALTVNFYRCLFEIDSTTVPLFAGVDMSAQHVKLRQSLAVVVAALDDPDRLLPALAALGKRHTNYGIKDHHFASVGAALLRALASSLGTAFTQEMHDAWAEAYALVASVMQRAITRADLAAKAETHTVSTTLQIRRVQV
jgi:nitric oxide dioxygenase